MFGIALVIYLLINWFIYHCGRIAVTEKGSMTLNFTVEKEPGHSSFPPKETSIGILAAAMSRWELPCHPVPKPVKKIPKSLICDFLNICVWGHFQIAVLYWNCSFLAHFEGQKCNSQPRNNCQVFALQLFQVSGNSLKARQVLSALIYSVATEIPLFGWHGFSGIRSCTSLLPQLGILQASEAGIESWCDCRNHHLHLCVDIKLGKKYIF